MIKVALVSDLHIGLTTRKQIDILFKQLAKEEIDLVIHAGDFSGGRYGHRGVEQILRLFRDSMSTTPAIGLLGNHDFWYAGKKIPPGSELYDPYYSNFKSPSLLDFTKNYNKCKEAFELNNVHFLDEKGIFKIEKNTHTFVFIGHSGWYSNPNPNTNDQNYLPIGIKGNTNNYLLNEFYKNIYQQLDTIVTYPKDRITLSIVTHFPIYKIGDDRKGPFELYSGPNIGTILEVDYNIKYFLEGHSHVERSGPIVYNCGSNYYAPKYKIIEIK